MPEAYFQRPFVEQSSKLSIRIEKYPAHSFPQKKTTLNFRGWLGKNSHDVLEAVVNAMDEIHRCSSLVENLNGRLRNYFFLRRNLGQGYLDLLRFFLNHRVFMRSEQPERIGKSSA